MFSFSFQVLQNSFFSKVFFLFQERKASSVAKKPLPFRRPGTESQELVMFSFYQMRMNGDSNRDNHDAGLKFDCSQTRITRFVKKYGSKKQVVNGSPY